MKVEAVVLGGQLRLRRFRRLGGKEFERRATETGSMFASGCPTSSRALVATAGACSS